MPRLSRLLGGMVLGAGAYVGYLYATWQPREQGNIYTHKPLVLGHRGAAAEAPANTVASFRKAIALGAAGVELDVHLTLDRQVVVIHDDTVTAVTGVAGKVRQMTLAEIQALDAGSHFGPEFAGERIPTLAQALEAVGPEAIVNIELKGLGVAPDGLEAEVLRIVQAHGMVGRVIASSFNPLRLIRLRQVAPHIPRGMLHGRGTPTFVRDLWFLPLVQPDALNPDHSLVDEHYMKRARRWGVRVNVWTVDDPAEARRLQALGVDSIITNDPRRILEALE
jgi:glycerophosphoryl diester phosphodiesterase